MSSRALRSPNASPVDSLKPRKYIHLGGLITLPPHVPLQGYLAHKKQPPPPKTTIGPKAYSYSRVLRGRVTLFLMSEVSLESPDTYKEGDILCIGPAHARTFL